MKRFFMSIFLVLCIGLFNCNMGYAEEAIESVDEAPAIEEVYDDETEEPLAATESVEEDELLGITNTSKPVWERIWGETALQTMQQILRTEKVFKKNRGGNVLIATASNYKDALACAGLAGVLDAPILITNGQDLSPETRIELKRLKPDWIGIVGGTSVVTVKVQYQLRDYCSDIERIAGQTAVGTANKIFNFVPVEKWDRTAIIVCGDTYKDALSIAPYSYWAWAPIMLTRPNSDPNKRILPGNALKNLRLLRDRKNQGRQGLERVVIVGGPKAVSPEVEKQLDKLNIPYIRIYGQNAIETSAACAFYAQAEGMTQTHLTVATTKSYKDALCAVPLCGKQSSVMILCDPNEGLTAFKRVCNSHSVEHGHVLGGPAAISENNFSFIKDWIMQLWD